MMHVRSLTHPVPIKSELYLYSEVNDQQIVATYTLFTSG